MVSRSSNVASTGDEASLAIVRAFVLDNASHDVMICWKGKNPLFRASDVAKVLSIVKIRNSVAKFCDDEKDALIVGTLGGPQKVQFLTLAGMYRLLYSSHGDAAKAFRKWLKQVLDSIQETGGYQLNIDREVEARTEQLIADSIKKNAVDLLDACRKEKHSALLQAYKGKRYVVYFGRVREMDDGKTLIKIGCSQDIVERSRSHIQEYGECLIFEIFECPCFGNSNHSSLPLKILPR
jgi:prophage antirepressor-like protein